MHLLPLLLYAAASAAYLAHFAWRDPRTGRLATGLLAGGVLAHTFLIGMRTVQAGHAPLVGTSAALSAFVWLLGLAYLYVELTADERAMGIFVAPLLVALDVIPVLDPAVSPRPEVLRSPLFTVHVVSMLFAYASFALASVLGITYVLLFNEIKAKHLGYFYARLPSLQMLDVMNGRVVTIGWVFLTLGIGSRRHLGDAHYDIGRSAGRSDVDWRSEDPDRSSVVGALLVRRPRAACDRLDRTPRGMAVSDWIRHRAPQLCTGRLFPDEESQLLSLRLFAVGLSHRSAPVELRERVDFSREGIERALDALAALGLTREMVVLSTCNRSEVYAALDRDDDVDLLARFFSEYHGVSQTELSRHLYVHRGAETARHVFRVAAGLDSLVVGEPQVFGQVKAAYTLAADRGLTGALVNRLFHAAFSAGKRVRSETGLADGAVSVSFAAVSLARKIFGTIKGRTVFIAGAGEMAALTGVHLKAQQAERIVIASRTPAAAEQLAADLSGEAIPWSELAVGLADADVAVTATGASSVVVSRELVQNVMRQRPHRPLFIIDIAVPRDVEPSAGDLEQVFVYNIDDLQQIVKDNLAKRGAELSRAEAIVEEETTRFADWLRSREVIPTVVALRQRFEAIRRAELQRLDSKLAGLPPEARARVDEVTRLVVEKLLLSPTEQLKTLGDETMVAVYSEALNRLFSLDSTGIPHNDPDERS